MTSERLRVINDRPPRAEGAFVLYWMIGARRTSWNFALDRAVEWATELRRPLVILEALRADYRWACDRFHQFAIEGMRDSARACARGAVTYFPYIEPASGAGRGLLRALAAHASVVVTDRTPVFDLPSLVERAAPQIPTRFEAVDGNGLLPLDAPPPGVVFPTAYAFRRFLQRELTKYLDDRPSERALSMRRLPATASLPQQILDRWPADARVLDGGDVPVATLSIDHSVRPVAYRGGETAARERLENFVGQQLGRYVTDRNNLDDEATSRLSPYLHFGHISTHEIAARVLSRDRWTPRKVSMQARGTREGWWGASPEVESFLDELITWRELGFHTATRVRDYDRFETLPAWAISTLETHAGEAREHVYSLEQFARAETHDPLWNAAQRQLLREGRIHNYLRMLWGKKILEWTASPREALDVMVELNNRYAVDGRDPNSYSGIMWVLGRYDRPWAPKRKIFGTVRYMSSANTARKLRVKGYLAR